MFANKLHEQAHETLKAGNIEKAIELYTRALEASPGDLNIYSDRGVAYLHANDQKNCMSDLDYVVNQQPDYAYRYACRAFAKNHFKDHDGAIADYEKAIKLDPNDAVAHNNLGLLLEQKGYRKAAEDRFERADKLSKQEDQLFQVMDDLESEKKATPLSESTDDPTSAEFERRMKQAEQKAENGAETELNQEDGSTPQENPETTSGSEEFKKVFTSRQQFKEFIQFVKNGFKIK